MNLGSCGKPKKSCVRVLCHLFHEQIVHCTGHYLSMKAVRITFFEGNCLFYFQSDTCWLIHLIIMFSILKEFLLCGDVSVPGGLHLLSAQYMSPVGFLSYLPLLGYCQIVLNVSLCHLQAIEFPSSILFSFDLLGSTVSITVSSSASLHRRKR